MSPDFDSGVCLALLITKSDAARNLRIMNGREWISNRRTEAIAFQHLIKLEFQPAQQLNEMVILGPARRGAVRSVMSKFIGNDKRPVLQLKA